MRTTLLAMAMAMAKALAMEMALAMAMAMALANKINILTLTKGNKPAMERIKKRIAAGVPVFVKQIDINGKVVLFPEAE